ncbi:F-box/kelch-repeat protein At3g04660 [Arabidopsis lyrata subsp. lyrata]|uniref:F-box/kelch-repeat protein At3g04660 n=1 Tax=Arabidopsis lyrata subsp. lyrata TaxID=81972 RepID=UPI000A29B72E|nr:F-box/kelch-repeat protein At3g04660 [Arabidopsis lyrata subsp. lyrata]|eukprot:XP_020879478.1 F-box/kelch-repeat protein At3g04660 [Arabidopsis lyrata subsp. lyrata]
MENNPKIRENDSSDYLPEELIAQILVNLPSKSVVKLIVVSKLWSSIICSKSFIDLYLERSLNRPCILFSFLRGNIRFFHSIFEKAILEEAAASPIDEYKVLCMTVLQVPSNSGPVVSEEHQVFTLGGAEKKKEAAWRMITCKVPHCPATQGICIDGVVYYGAWSNSKRKGSLIVAFDVRSEEFTLVKLPDGVEIYYDRDSELVNYQRKLALANLSYKEKFELLVLDKQEWSNISVMVPSLKDLVGQDLFYLRGAISSGEFIFTPMHSDWSSFIISYDRKEEIARRVELKGIKDRSPYMRVFLNHVECPIFL